MRFLLLLLMIATAQARTIYLQPGTWGGDGSRESPLQIAGPDHFDAVLRWVDREGVEEIVLGAGVFETLGTWDFPDYALVNPITIRGAGMDRTTIRLHHQAITHTGLADRPDLIVMRFGRPWQNNGGPFLIEDLTIDGNEAAFPKARLVTGGLVFHSNNVTCRRVHVRGLRGEHQRSIEAFGILINNFTNGPYAGPDGGNRLEECVVESTGDDLQEYISPFYIGVEQHGRPIMPSVILDCRTLGTGDKPVRLGVSIQSGVTIERFGADNVLHAVYNDVGPVKDATVRNSRFTRVAYSGPWIIVDAPKERVLVERCEFEFTPLPDGEWIGLVVWDKAGTGAVASDVEVRDCVFRGASPSKPFRVLSVGQTKAKGLKLTGNTYPAGAVMPASSPALMMSPR